MKEYTLNFELYNKTCPVELCLMISSSTSLDCRFFGFKVYPEL